MMELTLEQSDSHYYIHHYMAGQWQVNQTVLLESAIVTPTQLLHPWPPANFAELTPAHLAVLLPLAPELILLGTGAQGRICPSEWLMPFFAKKIGVEVMASSAACRTFNVLAAEGRNVAAAIIVS